MRRSRRLGFTFIELLVVMIVLGVLATVGVPRIRNMKERSYQATLRNDLGALRTAQEAYFTEHQQYATDTLQLDYRASANVTVTIISDDPFKGWRAAAKHAWLEGPCTTAVGAEATDAESGVIICTSLAVPASSATSNP